MLRRATPTEWYRCLAGPSDAPRPTTASLVDEPPADEQAGDAPSALEQSAYWRRHEDDDD
jgi:hypothetical protein